MTRYRSRSRAAVDRLKIQVAKWIEDRNKPPPRRKTIVVRDDLITMVIYKAGKRRADAS
jgi:hypothetical protein